MNSKLILGLMLVLGAGLFGSSHVGADESSPVSNSSSQPVGHTYRNAKHGFQFLLPQGWSAREKGFFFAHYEYGFLTINNQRPDLSFQGWGGTWLCNDHRTQLQPGEVYIAIGYAGGPTGMAMRNDTVGDDLKSLLATNQLKFFSSSGVSYCGVTFFKRGQQWFIQASMKEPVTQENRQKVIALLQSFRFVNTPVNNAAWAESLAWKALPEKIRDTQGLWGGWPSIGQECEQSGTGTIGQRSVLVTNVGSAYSVKFTLKAIGTWPFRVTTNGSVQAEPAMVHSVGPSPSQWPSDLPGTNGGILDSYWFAPYVQVVTEFGKQTMIWFSQDGSIKRQAAIRAIQSGYVLISNQPHTIRGINEDWQIKLPSGPSDIRLAGYITATADSRVFVHERHPKQGLVALDIYVHGKLANTVGPYWQYGGDYMKLNDDGSAALLVTETNMTSNTPKQGAALRDAVLAGQRVHAQVVVCNTNGRVQFKADCGPAVRSPMVAPDGRGVLLRSNSGTNQNGFTWFSKAGKGCSMNLSPNPEFMGWVPGTCQSLFSTSIGYQSGPLALIDWSTGKITWKIPSPGKGEVIGIGFTPRLILFAVAEPYPSGTWHKVNQSLFQSGKKWVRTFYAVDVRNGKIVAHWRGQFPHRYFDHRDERFLGLKGNLFYVTGNEFTEINADDIWAKRNDWQ